MTKLKVAKAREIALEVLTKVVDQGAYANLALQQILSSEQLAQADKALVTELVYGSLKQRLTVDWHLQSFLSKPLGSLPVLLQNVLRLGAYQILYLDRVPPRAAIN
ncbi:MAG TPA: transcription antitermination factor NusB, partial [Candidatus Deferrimicrobium sp.]|nr:transcription antitermination factor NusB [Candidatus Deferrimicrobium sp.]